MCERAHVLFNWSRRRCACCWVGSHRPRWLPVGRDGAFEAAAVVLATARNVCARDDIIKAEFMASLEDDIAVCRDMHQLCSDARVCPPIRVLCYVEVGRIYHSIESEDGESQGGQLDEAWAQALGALDHTPPEDVLASSGVVIELPCGLPCGDLLIEMGKPSGSTGFGGHTLAYQTGT